MLQITHDINISSGSFAAACTDSNYIYATTNVPDYRIYNWTASLQSSALSLAATPAAIVLGTAASAVINYSSARVSIVDSLYNKTDITTNALAVFSTTSGQQSASNGSGTVISTTSTNSKVCSTNVSAQTVTQISPAPLSTHQASCIIYRADAGTWVVGTNNGLVFEMNATGGQIGGSLGITNTPNIAAPAINVTGLSYYNNTLAVVTNYGIGYTYTWPGQVLLNTFLTGAGALGSTGSTSCLTDSASGTCLILPGGFQSPNSTSAVSELFINTVSGSFPIVTTTYNEAITGCFCGGIQPTITGSQISKAWVVFNDSNSLGVQLRLYNISNPSFCSETTRFQSPVGTDVSSRCIRIRDEGIGRSTIEIDQNVSAGAQPVNATSDRQYIELNLYSGNWDIREFST